MHSRTVTCLVVNLFSVPSNPWKYLLFACEHSLNSLPTYVCVSVSYCASWCVSVRACMCVSTSVWLIEWLACGMASLPWMNVAAFSGSPAAQVSLSLSLFLSPLLSQHHISTRGPHHHYPITVSLYTRSWIECYRPICLLASFFLSATYCRKQLIAAAVRGQLASVQLNQNMSLSLLC